MKFVLRTLVAWALVISAVRPAGAVAATCLPSQEGLIETAAPDLAKLLPAPSEIPSWELDGEPFAYTDDNLWEYIDGSAENFLAFDFRRMIAQDYMTRAQKGLKVEIYEHCEPAHGVRHLRADAQPGPRISRDRQRGVLPTSTPSTSGRIATSCASPCSRRARAGRGIEGVRERDRREDTEGRRASSRVVRVRRRGARAEEHVLPHAGRSRPGAVPARLRGLRTASATRRRSSISRRSPTARRPGTRSNGTFPSCNRSRRRRRGRTASTSWVSARIPTRGM